MGTTTRLNNPDTQYGVSSITYKFEMQLVKEDMIIYMYSLRMLCIHVNSTGLRDTSTSGDSL
jgi:hypothetical protein